MSLRIVAVCDACGVEVRLKTGDADTESVEHDLQLEGWSMRNDAIRHLCPNHPRPVR